MPSITRDELAALTSKVGRIVVQKAPGEILAVFVPGKLVNPLNASAWGWQKRARLAKQWKERVGMAIMEGGYGDAWRHPWALTSVRGQWEPKSVTFLAKTWNVLDSDGLQAALKPVRDALQECGVIHSDAPYAGHEFIYTQQIDRARRGVEIHVSLRGGR